MGSGKWRQMFLPPPSCPTHLSLFSLLHSCSNSDILACSAALPHIRFPSTHPAKTEMQKLFQEKISDQSLDL